MEAAKQRTFGTKQNVTCMTDCGPRTSCRYKYNFISLHIGYFVGQSMDRKFDHNPWSLITVKLWKTSYGVLKMIKKWVHFKGLLLLMTWKFGKSSQFFLLSMKISYKMSFYCSSESKYYKLYREIWSLKRCKKMLFQFSGLKKKENNNKEKIRVKSQRKCNVLNQLIFKD